MVCARRVDPGEIHSWNQMCATLAKFVATNRVFAGQRQLSTILRSTIGSLWVAQAATGSQQVLGLSSGDSC